jgi:hypothetical protein
MDATEGRWGMILWDSPEGGWDVPVADVPQGTVVTSSAKLEREGNTRLIRQD